MDYDVNAKLYSELIAQGVPSIEADKIARQLSPKVTAAIKRHLTKGKNMVSLLGQTVANVQTITNDMRAKIHAEFPNIPATESSIGMITLNLINKYPTWTEDQIYAELRKNYMPKTSGGYLQQAQTYTQAMQQEAMKRIITIGGIVAAGAVLWMLLRRRRAA